MTWATDTFLINLAVDNFSTQDGSATVVNDLTSEDREFLSRLLRILPRVLESGDDDPKLRGERMATRLPILPATNYRN